MTLKDIAQELLQKYRDSEAQVISEFYDDPEKGEQELTKEVDRYNMLIEEAARNEDPQANESDKWG